MERSRLDPTQIAQMTYDEVSRATKVKLQDTEMNMELSADDGDSVLSEPVKLVTSAVGCDEADNNSDVIPALDCSKLREVHVSVEGTGSVDVLLSPVDSGDFFYTAGHADAIIKVCARRIKVKSNNVVGNVHLVGRS